MSWSDAASAPFIDNVFENMRTGLRNAINDFEDNNCDPPWGGSGKAFLKIFKVIATLHTPTAKDIKIYKKMSADARNGSHGMSTATKVGIGATAATAAVQILQALGDAAVLVIIW